MCAAVSKLYINFYLLCLARDSQLFIADVFLLPHLASWE